MDSRGLGETTFPRSRTNPLKDGRAPCPGGNGKVLQAYRTPGLASISKLQKSKAHKPTSALPVENRPHGSLKHKHREFPSQIYSSVRMGPQRPTPTWLFRNRGHRHPDPRHRLVQLAKYLISRAWSSRVRRNTALPVMPTSSVVTLQPPTHHIQLPYHAYLQNTHS